MSAKKMNVTYDTTFLLFRSRHAGFLIPLFRKTGGILLVLRGTSNDSDVIHCLFIFADGGMTRAMFPFTVDYKFELVGARGYWRYDGPHAT